MGKGRVKRNGTPDIGTGFSEEASCVTEKVLGTDTEDKLRWDKSDAVFVFQQCFLSRLYIFFAQFLFNIAVTDFPSKVFRSVENDHEDSSVLDRVINFGLSGFARWDSQHFLYIAANGYTFEHNLAFFPFFPYVTYFIAWTWHWIFPLLHFSTALLVTAISINLAAFLVSGQLLYILLLSLCRSRRKALIGCILFSLNPASIFFSAAYTESLFAMFTFGGLVVLYTKWVSSTARYCLSACLFAVAFLTRSNGILNFGYICYHLLLDILYCPVTRNYFWEEDVSGILLKIGKSFYIGVICFGLFSSLVVLHGSKMFDLFCSPPVHSTRFSSSVISYARENNYVLPGELEKIPWCSANRSVFNPIPVFYTSIQQRYWDVKFMGYWRLIKLPCFILAAPALIIVTYGFICYLRSQLTPHVSFFKAARRVLRDRTNVLPFALQAVAVALTGVFFYNVEVVTRILFSSAPFIYWYLANFMHSGSSQVTIDDMKVPRALPFLTNFCQTRFVHKVLLCYLLGYFFVGTALHVNWLPWT